MAERLRERARDDGRRPLAHADASGGGDAADGAPPEAAIRPEVIEFWWPQIPDGEIDQRLPVACDALRRFVEARTGPRRRVLLVEPEPSLVGADAAEALHALASSSIRVVGLPAALVTVGDAGAKQAAWAQLAAES